MPIAITSSLLFLFAPTSMFLVSFFPLPISGISQPIRSTPPRAIENKKGEPPCDRFTEGVLEESDMPEHSMETCWWVDSGGVFFVENGKGTTLKGILPTEAVWRLKYAHNNPTDTNVGFRPQNIFRLINRKKWTNVSQEVLFKVKDYDKSPSQNRNMSNGILLMSRYVDSDNLYYAGLRVDGTAVIKKKADGQYVTLATARYIESAEYDIDENPLLLPKNKWIGERLVTKNNPDGSVNLKLYINMDDSNKWRLILDVDDSLASSGSSPFTTPGNIGIRSDFMDVDFSDFQAKVE